MVSKIGKGIESILIQCILQSFPDDPQVAALKQLCDTISKEEEDFVADIDSFLTLHEERQECKKEILYRKWCERVFVPIQTKLAAQIASVDFHFKGSEKRSLFDQYLCYRNKKEVFLDTLNSEDPTPTGGAFPVKLPQRLKVNHSVFCSQVYTGVLDDPLIAPRTDYAKEKLVLNGCDQGIPLEQCEPRSGNGRSDTDPMLWLSMKIMHIDSEVRLRSK